MRKIGLLCLCSSDTGQTSLGDSSVCLFFPKLDPSNIGEFSKGAVRLPNFIFFFFTRFWYGGPLPACYFPRALEDFLLYRPCFPHIIAVIFLVTGLGPCWERLRPGPGCSCAPVLHWPPRPGLQEERRDSAWRTLSWHGWFLLPSICPSASRSLEESLVLEQVNLVLVSRLSISLREYRTLFIWVASY